MSCQMQDRDGRWIEAIPEPYWQRSSFYHLFRLRPMCWTCQQIFKDVAGYEEHYVTTHLSEDQNEAAR